MVHSRVNGTYLTDIRSKNSAFFREVIHVVYVRALRAGEPLRV